MSRALRGLRGATTIHDDTVEQIHERVIALLGEMFEQNGLENDDLVSVIFTATDDIHSTFPATVARKFGLGDVPLICARELDVVDGTPMCIRVLMHIETERSRGELHHVYLEGARNLRDDLPA